MVRLIKITIISLFILLLAIGIRHLIIELLSSTPDRITREWQTVTINALGTFRVPMEWNVEEQDGILYITDKPRVYGDYTIYIVGAVEFKVGFRLHELFEGVERGDTLRSHGFTNPADLLWVEYTVNGVKQEHYLINLCNFEMGEYAVSYALFVWNRDTVNEWLVRQIAKTFSRNRDVFDITNAGQLKS